MPCCGADHFGGPDFGCVVLADQDDAGMSILIVIVRSLLDHAASDVIGRATISDRFKEVGNGLVAVRRNRNALARADEAHDSKGAYIGLAGSRRPFRSEEQTSELKSINANSN